MTQNNLICLDLDGTLLNDAGLISDENKLALVSCLDKGDHVYIASGRPHYFADRLAQLIDPRVEVISYNGASYDLKGERFFNTLSGESVKSLVSFLDSYNMKYFLKTETKIFTNDDSGKFNYIDYGIPHLPLDSLKGDVIKIVGLQYDLLNFDLIVSHLSSQYHVSHYVDKGFELVSFESSKGSAIEKVAKGLKIPVSQIYVFGDDVNDLSMFEVSGNSIAMMNACDELKEVSTFVTLSNNESGVAHALHALKVIV